MWCWSCMHARRQIRPPLPPPGQCGLTSSLSQFRLLSVCRSLRVSRRPKPSLSTSWELPPRRALDTSASIFFADRKGEVSIVLSLSTAGCFKYSAAVFGMDWSLKTTPLSAGGIRVSPPRAWALLARRSKALPSPRGPVRGPPRLGCAAPLQTGAKNQSWHGKH